MWNVPRISAREFETPLKIVCWCTCEVVITHGCSCAEYPLHLFGSVCHQKLRRDFDKVKTHIYRRSGGPSVNFYLFTFLVDVHGRVRLCVCAFSVCKKKCVFSVCVIVCSVHMCLHVQSTYGVVYTCIMCVCVCIQSGRSTLRSWRSKSSFAKTI